MAWGKAEASGKSDAKSVTKLGWKREKRREKRTFRLR
jgi:hypothetical protein